MTQRTHPSGNQKGKPRRRSSTPTRWVLQDPELLRVVFRVFEDLTTLRQCCSKQVATAWEIERLFGSLLWKPDESGLQRWRRLADMILTSWTVVDETVRTNRLDPAQYQEAYRRMLRVRVAWGQLDRQTDSLERIDHITDGLRQLLIGYAQARGQGTRPQS